MRFTTSAPAIVLRSIAQVSTVDNIEAVDDRITFTIDPREAVALIVTLDGMGYTINAGRPRQHGIAPAPRAIPATSAIVKR